MTLDPAPTQSQDVPTISTSDPSKPKRSLGDMLIALRAADDGVLDEDLDLEALGQDLRSKVDDIVAYMDFCNARASAIGKRAAELSAKASAFANRAARLEAYVVNRMEADRVARLADLPTGAKEERYKLPGHDHEFVLYHSEAAIPKLPADAATYLKYKGLVRRSYAWNLADLKKALKADSAAFKDVVTIERRPNIKISAKA
jgi:hypothetical protein